MTFYDQSFLCCFKRKDGQTDMSDLMDGFFMFFAYERHYQLRFLRQFWIFI
jgi:hypothetical protein